jgi:hypothetical protein
MNFPSPIVRSSNPEGADHAQDAPDLRSHDRRRVRDAGRRGARPQLVELTGPVTRLEVAVRDLERDVAALAEQREWTA